jgi:hypothetical protein
MRRAYRRLEVDAFRRRRGRSSPRSEEPDDHQGTDCCKYGIALFDRAEPRQAFSPNVAYELGMLHQQNKNCLVLKHSSLPPMPFDVIKDLYTLYDEDLKLRSIISKWISEIGFEASESPAVATS